MKALGVKTQSSLIFLMILHSTLPEELRQRLEATNADISDAAPHKKRGIFPKTCDATVKYRNIDGFCNNLEHPEYGTPMQPFVRLLDPVYDDGKCKPRLFRGERDPLPGARSVILGCTLTSNAHTTLDGFSQNVMQWGQFLDHDITFAPNDRELNSCDGIRDDGTHPDYDTCGRRFPIKIPDGDRFFKTRCMNFTRSMFITDNKGVRQQFNNFTVFIDGSQLYGSSEDRILRLRENIGGRLYTPSDFLQPDDIAPVPCIIQKPASACFLTGEDGGNFATGMMAYDVIFSREHNRIAGQLAGLNPHWDDEKLFQESRRIIVAYIQHITYSAFLPKILGKTTMQAFGLLSGYQYNKDINPNTFQSFNTAAYRFGHSLLTNNYPIFSNKDAELKKLFFRPHLLLEGSGKGIDAIIAGLSNTKLQRVDNVFARGISDHLFQDVLFPGSAFDLLSLNVQRGRDHGVPSYERFREHCAKLSGLHTMKPSHAFCESVYDKREDVDLFIGGISEDPVPDGMVGPTFACIIALQFQKLKNGDRFFYETRDEYIHFAPDQLAEIKKITLSRIMCDNTRITMIQPDAFLLGHCHNRKKCSDLPRVDLTPWKETL